MNVRTETQSDHQKVFEVIEQAFRSEALSDHKEQFLVERLRESAAFVAELSLVTEIGVEIGTEAKTSIDTSSNEIVKVSY